MLSIRKSVVIISCVLQALCCVGCAPPPRIDVSASLEGGRVIFNIDHHHINGLLRFQVRDSSGNLLWDLDLSYERSRRIEYGVLPTKGGRPAKQVYPPANTTLLDIRGTTVQILIEYQYDAPWPSSGTFQKTIAIP